MRSISTLSKRLPGVLLVVVFGVWLQGSASAQPANDLCADAICVTDGIVFEGSTVDATGVDVTTCSVVDDLDVWHTYTPASSGDVTISLCDSGFDTTLSVFDACDGEQLACDDDFCGLLSQVIVDLTANTTYWIRVSGFFHQTGDYALLVSGGGGVCSAPPNDDCLDAIPLACDDVVVGSTVGATDDGAPACIPNAPAPGVWYTLIGAGSDVTADLCSEGTSYDSQIWVYKDGCAALTCVVGDDDGCGNLRSQVTWFAEVGVKYLILVHGFSGSMGPFELHITCVAENDECDDCIAVSEGTFMGTTDDNSGVTGDDSSCAPNDTIDEWYCYTASCNGTATAELCESGFNTTVSVFNACEGAEIDCDDNSCDGEFPQNAQVSWSVTANTTYFVRVSGANGERGDYSLTIDCAPGGLLNDDCQDATPIFDGDTFFSTIGATTDGPPHSDCGVSLQIRQDIWYVYTAPDAAEVTVSLCNPDTNFDTKLAAYLGVGCPVDDDRLMACNDDRVDCDNNASKVTFSVGCGEQYLIRVGGFLSQEGVGTITVTTTVTINDDCANATPVSEGSFDLANCGSTTDGPDEPGDCDFGGYTHIDSDIWFRYTPSCTGDATVSLCDSAFDTKVGIYGADCPGGSGEVLVCDDDFCGPGSQVTLPVVADNEYLIRVGGRLGAQGLGRMDITLEAVDVEGDSDCDGDVDVLDYQAFQACFSGPGIPAGIFCRLFFDFDADNDVDMLDWRLFQTFFTG